MTAFDPRGARAALDRVERALAPSGIVARGVACFSGEDGPKLRDGGSARSVLLLGHVGGSLWPAFDLWRKSYDGPDPLDTWSRSLIQPVAEAVGATAYYPSDRPWQPFQAWAKAAEGLRASPLGMLIHPQFGLWHGYRGALGFAFMVEPEPFHGAHPCDGCIDKPCLSACPAGAVTPERFDVGLCRDHLRNPAHGQHCMSGGCSARDRCPVGQHYRYPQEQIQFHMRMLGI